MTTRLHIGGTHLPNASAAITLATSHPTALCCTIHLHSKCLNSAPLASIHLHPVTQPSTPCLAKSIAFFDLSECSEHDVCNILFLEEIRDRVEYFEARSLIVWIGRNMPYIDVNHVAEAFASQFGLDYSSIQVSKHSPADFLVSIYDWDAFEEAAGRDSFTFGGRQFRLRRWSKRDQANRAAMRYHHVCLSLEGVPLHLWIESFAAWIIGQSCTMANLPRSK
jgi:hypothetical protein